MSRERPQARTVVEDNLDGRWVGRRSAPVCPRVWRGGPAGASGRPYPLASAGPGRDNGLAGGRPCYRAPARATARSTVLPRAGPCYRAPARGINKFAVRDNRMWSVLRILLWPIAAALRLGLEVLIWFRPSIAQGRCVFPESIRRLIEQATEVEVHYAELGSDEPPQPGQLGTPMGFQSLGMVRLDAERDRRKVIRSVLKANQQCLGGFKCLDAEYAVRFKSKLGSVELTICFWCMQVWVKADAEGGDRFYPISGRPLYLLDSFLQKARVPKPAREEIHA